MNSVLTQPSPSKDIVNYWQFARSTTETNRLNPKYCGKWLVFVDLANLDNLWEKVKTLTEKGILGPSAKTATARPNSSAKDIKIKVIIVYTKNYFDLDDVARVAWLLYENKIFTGPVLNYKTDKATYKGIYAIKSEKASVYSIKIHSFSIHDTQAKLTEFFKSKYSSFQK